MPFPAPCSLLYAKKKLKISLELFVKVGGDLLFHFRSTIGANGLNFSVRNGKRWNPVAITTLRPFRLFAFRVPGSGFRVLRSSLVVCLLYLNMMKDEISNRKYLFVKVYG